MHSRAHAAIIAPFFITGGPSSAKSWRNRAVPDPIRASSKPLTLSCTYSVRKDRLYPRKALLKETDISRDC